MAFAILTFNFHYLKPGKFKADVRAQMYEALMAYKVIHNGNNHIHEPRALHMVTEEPLERMG